MASPPEGVEPAVIHAWSAPRSLSTSLMYSFSERDDMDVLDEPLYANFLRVTGVDRPYRQELLSKMDPDGNKVVKEVIFGPGEKAYRYCKHIAKQRLPNLTGDLMKKGKHFILIRNPMNILPSFDKVVPPSFLELGVAELVAIYSELCELGSPPPVIDADDLRRDPEAVLSGLCEDLGIPFQPQMLKWKAGPRDFDGIWAPWWYESVHTSTGFSKSRRYPMTFPFALYDLLEQSLPFYNMLKRQVSVFDSVVQGGDAVWEGLRIYDGKVFKLEEHLDRLFDSTKAMAFSNVPSRDWIKDAIFKTLNANGMFNNAHIRLTLTRGKKVTSGMSPTFNLYGCVLIVLAEWKPPVYDNSHGIKLVTATTRRNSPNIEGNLAQAEDAIMLDQDGFVSETNATNIFMVKKGIVLTPHADYCLPGITRATPSGYDLLMVMDLVVKENLVLHERRISLSEFHAADENLAKAAMKSAFTVPQHDWRDSAVKPLGPGAFSQESCAQPPKSLPRWKNTVLASPSLTQAILAHWQAMVVIALVFVMVNHVDITANNLGTWPGKSPISQLGKENNPLCVLLWSVDTSQPPRTSPRRGRPKPRRFVAQVWTTGTMGEITPAGLFPAFPSVLPGHVGVWVVMIDGREIGDGKIGLVTRQIQSAYKVLTAGLGVPIPRNAEA
ncbi:Branched-chain-amino-acid aminotransferase-like protein 1 [Triticum urartu]|uniref:Branched-chain-amino-acid aminotransferase-like protein 1 n=1 Tax=Triticum urartu TaxID=4572 RepID=M8B0B3_TRIUA|nr:Branched-chain-amino-acid aminotransferase-like protein 1 [Triticum urartu]